MANPDCIWLKDKTCFRATLKKTMEYALCQTCIAATDLADRSGNFTIADNMGPQ